MKNMNHVRDQVMFQVEVDMVFHDQVREQVMTEVYGQVGEQVGDQVKIQVVRTDEGFGLIINYQVISQVCDHIWNQL